LAGIYKASSWVALVAGSGIILGAAYMLVLYRRVCFGEQKNADAAAMPDLSAREWALMVPLVVATLWMGIYPETFIAPFRADIAHLEARLAAAKPAGDAQVTRGHKVEAEHELAHESGAHGSEK
jgi:NADH-quinone oxidoreductase subunit M